MYNNNYSNNGYGNNNMYSGSYGSNYAGGIAKPNSYGHNNNAYSSYGSGYGNNAVNRMNSSYSAGKSAYGMSNNGMMANQPMQSYSYNYSPANSSYLGNRSNSASSTKYMQNGYENTGSGYLNNDSEIHGRPVTKRGVEVKELRKKDSSGFLYAPKVSGSEKILRKSENPKNIESHDPSGAEKYSKALSIYPKERASGFFGKLSEIMEKDYLREEGKELLGFKKSNQKEDEEMEISYENVGKNLFSKYKDGSGNSERNSKLPSKSSNSVKKRGSLFGGGSSNNDDGGDDEEERQLAKKEKKARNKLDYFDDDYDTSDIFDYDENFDNPQMYRDQVKKKFWNFLKKKD
jgi:hypothetical protein